jgi:hypothetical protein
VLGCGELPAVAKPNSTPCHWVHGSRHFSGQEPPEAGYTNKVTRFKLKLKIRFRAFCLGHS